MIQEILNNGQILYEMRGGEVLQNTSDIITRLVIATKGNKELAKEIINFRQYKNTEYYVNGLGEVMRKKGNKYFFVAQNLRNKDSYLRIKFLTPIEIEGKERKQINSHTIVASCFLKNNNSEYNQINHKNFIKNCNEVWNLEHCNSLNNNRHMFLLTSYKKSKANVFLYCSLDFENFIREKDFKGDILWFKDNNNNTLLIKKDYKKSSNKCKHLNFDKLFDERVKEIQEIYKIKYA